MNDFPTECKRGTACYRIECVEQSGTDLAEQSSNVGEQNLSCKKKLMETENSVSKWVIDREMPILKGSDRMYVDRHIYVGEI